jgi:hypothetical protein
MGRPPRHERQAAFTLTEGGYCRIVVNGRHSAYEIPWYSQSTYNVVFEDAPSGDSFVVREPSGVLDMRANLL